MEGHDEAAVPHVNHLQECTPGPIADGVLLGDL